MEVSKEAAKAKDGHRKEDVPGPKAYLSTIINKVTPKNFKLPQESENSIQDAPLTDKDVRAMIAENPRMDASTFYNLLKSKGCEITKLQAPSGDDKTTEADSGSSFAQVTRAGINEGPKYDSCVKKVKKQGTADNAYAVCGASLGTTKEGGEGSGRHPYGKVTVKDDNKKNYGKVIVKDQPKQNFGSVKFSSHESKNITIKSNRFLEAVKGDTKGVNGNPQSEIVGFTKFKVVLLQEGMGNFRDGYWYSKDALTSAVPIFEGAKIYADHPSKMDEAVRPERTVRDILGNFEDVHLEESDDGRTLLVGTVSILGDESYRWARALMEHAVDFAKKYPDKEFVGLSINANGDAKELRIEDLINSGVPESTLPKIQKAKEEGVESVNLVSIITDAVSCDLVTEAGAGGKVLQMLEGEKQMKQKKEKGGTAIPGKAGNNVDDSVDKKHGHSVADEDEAGMEHSESSEDSEDGEDAEHDDEQQDIELIKKMIKQHMGDDHDEDPSEEEMGVVKEAYEAHKEMGYKEEEAAEKAVHQLKVAKHMAAKKEAAKKESGSESESEAHHESECENEESEAHKQNEKHKEAMLKLKAENAKLRESLRKIEINNHISTLCQKSKLPTHITKAFREALGAPVSVEAVNKSWKLFEAGLKKADEELGGFAGLVITPEKTTSAAGKSSIFDSVMKD